MGKDDERVHIRKIQRTMQDGIVSVREKLIKLAAQEQPKWDEIRSLTCMQLLDALKTDRFTPLDVLRAYQQAAIAANEKTNCLTELVLEAEQWANELLAKYSDDKGNRPPLYGLPISLKDIMEVEGHISTSGYTTIYDNSKKDCVPVTVFKELGAIPFAHTNIPQTLMTFNCANPVYGCTKHPLDEKRTPGGSSGGEAALLALKGAPIGIGTDGGGSIRIPSSFCGLTGIKPTTTRVSMKGVTDYMAGQMGIGVAWGPMGHDVESIANLLRLVLNNETSNLLDPYIPYFPFRDHIFNAAKPLKIGWYDYDGWWDCVPAMKRAVHEVRDALESRGHTLVPWKPPRIVHAVKLFGTLFSPDGGARMMELTGAGIREPLMDKFYMIFQLPLCVKRLVRFITSFYWSQMSETVSVFTDTTTTKQLYSMYGDAGKYRDEVVDDWRAAGLDCVLAPAFNHPAPTHELPAEVMAHVITTAMYNLLDFPAGNVPVSSVTKEDEKQCLEEYPERDMFYRRLKKDFTAGSVGLPVGVQCVALPNNDEMCLRLMKEVEETTRRA